MRDFNFGEVEIDTENRNVTIVIRDIENKGYFSKTFNLDTEM